jgi:protein-S-isoprenylcysteine O-methyltransferase Ste14
MHTAFLTLIVGLSLVAATWLVGITGVSAYGFTMLVRTPKDERMMLPRFGVAYMPYTGRTGRFFPPLIAQFPKPHACGS